MTDGSIAGTAPLAADEMAASAGRAMEGHFDGIDARGRAVGWARHLAIPDKAVLAILIDGEEVDAFAVGEFRPDLAAAGFADPCCAFWRPVPDRFLDGIEHIVELRYARTADPLPGSPRPLRLTREQVAAASRDEAPADAGPGMSPGSFDGVDHRGYAAGWARPPADGGKAALLVAIDGTEIGGIVADQLRDDLLANGMDDPEIAFWYRIPAAFLDGQPHEIAIRRADTGKPLPDSPRRFALQPPGDPGHRASRNILPNAGFRDWPSGIVVHPHVRYEQPIAGWLFDYGPGPGPDLLLSVDKPANLGLRDDEYALKLVVAEGGGGQFRLIVPLEIDPAEIAAHRLSLGVRRPAHATETTLHIRGIELATWRDGAIGERFGPVRRNLRPRGTQRIGNLAIVDPAHAPPPAGTALALVFEFDGEGEMLLFSPSLSPADTVFDPAVDVAGAFEDPCIRDQVDHLVLAPIWTSDRRAAAGRAVGAAPIPARQATAGRVNAAVPFIEIVVPVFNAAIHVEELLRSILDTTDSPFQILLHDDASGEFTRQRARQWTGIDPRIRYEGVEANLGYTRNINRALQAGMSEFVVLLNSDTIVTPGWLRKLYEVIAADDRVAAVGPLSNAASWQSVPRTKSPRGEWVVNSFPPGLPPPRIAAIIDRIAEGEPPSFPLLNGFCTMFRRGALDEVGYFDDVSFPRGYGEENDLCIRLTRAGHELKVAINAYVHHEKSMSFGVAARSTLSRQANQVLRGKHPEVDFAALEERMRTDPAINRVRTALARVVAGVVDA